MPNQHLVNVLLLMPESMAEATWAAVADLPGLGQKMAVNSREALHDAFKARQWQLLMAFGTGVIVPRSILETDQLCAVNVHGATPEYPGRDPHHFAAYDNVVTYGATLHYMTPAVDQGPIISVREVAVRSGSRPVDLLNCANGAGKELVEQFLRSFVVHGAPAPDPTLRWKGPVRTRREFIELCRVDPSMSPAEMERREKAVAMPGYSNLFMELHGRRFRLEE